MLFSVCKQSGKGSADIVLLGRAGLSVGLLKAIKGESPHFFNGNVEQPYRDLTPQSPEKRAARSVFG